MMTTTTCCVLFADIVDSTRYYATLGDAPAQRILSQALARMTAAAQSRRGVVIKTIGDEVMCTFRNPNDAACAARAMHNELEELSIHLRLPQYLTAHIGLHHGLVIQEDGDVFGDAVNVAARLVAMAKPRESVTSEATIHVLNAEEQERAHLTTQARLKGKAGSFNIYELTWEDPGLTTAPLLVGVQPETPTCLRFWRGDNVREVKRASSFTIGRHAHNDFVADSPNVSRTHAYIERRRDRYFLTDVSTNGTYVCEEGCAGIWVWRDVVELHTGGTIGLGEPVLKDAEDTIYYDIQGEGGAHERPNGSDERGRAGVLRPDVQPGQAA